MAALPTVNGDSGTWGTKLNAFLTVAHDPATGYLATQTNLLTFGSGDNPALKTNTITPQWLHLLKGTATSADTVQTPLVQINRHVTATEGQIMATAGVGTQYPGDDLLCGMRIDVRGLAPCEGQATGLYAEVHSVSTTGTLYNDACAFAGIGVSDGSNNGIGIGAALEGRRYSTAVGSGLTAAQLLVRNLGGASTSYNATGFTGDSGMSIHNIGPVTTGDVGCAIQIPNYTGAQFKVGLGIPAQVNGGKTGGVADSSFRDDGNSTTSLDIRGAHTTSLSIAANAGNVGIGIASTAGSMVRIQADATTKIGLQLLQPTGTPGASLLACYDATGVTEIWSVRASGNMALIDHDWILGTSTGTKIGTATSQKLGFYNVTPIVQPATTGTTTGFVASTGTTVVSGSTFTGNTGSTAYTIGDVVRALKLLGLMAA